MAGYELSWITNSIALGHAPMSYAELDSIKEQGIGAIVNLCAEFCDLHEIEQASGFEVYYLPVCDNDAPAEQELEKALDWLDEAVYLGKRVLVHCRFGMGRTATFVAAYLLRKGFGLKVARKKVDEARSMHSSFSQWKLLRRYSKKSGVLSIREPSLENRRVVDLGSFFHDYEALFERVDELFQKAVDAGEDLLSCGSGTDACCYNFVQLSLIEATYLNHHMNRILTGQERKRAIDRAVQVSRNTRQIRKALKDDENAADDGLRRFREAYQNARILCPLSIDRKCLMYSHRPIVCRIFGLTDELLEKPLQEFGSGVDGNAPAANTLREQIQLVLHKLSADMFQALTSRFQPLEQLTFPLAEAVSGRFIQKYFEYLSHNQKSDLIGGRF